MDRLVLRRTRPKFGRRRLFWQRRWQAHKEMLQTMTRKSTTMVRRMRLYFPTTEKTRSAHPKLTVDHLAKCIFRPAMFSPRRSFNGVVSFGKNSATPTSGPEAQRTRMLLSSRVEGFSPHSLCRGSNSRSVHSCSEHPTLQKLDSPKGERPC